MKLVDLNVLLYTVDRQSPQHARAEEWLRNALAGGEPVGFAWIVVLGFLRLATNARVFASALTPEQAIIEIDRLLAHPNVRLVSESSQHWSLISDLLRETGTAGDLTTDAHLAAIAIATGATIASGDTDFARFKRVKWENPFAIE